MKLSTRDEVRHAYEQYVEENYERDRNFRLYWDGEREWNEDVLDFADEPGLEVMVHQDSDGGITIHQELTNERAEVSFPQDVELRWLRDNSARIEPEIRIERENEIRENLRVIGGTIEVIWEYRLNPEQVRLVHELLRTSTFNDLQSVVWQKLPDSDDSSDASQEFHRALLRLGIIPRILVEDESIEMQGRSLYGDDTFDALTDEQITALNGE